MNSTMFLVAVFGAVGISAGITGLIAFDMKLDALGWTCVALALLTVGVMGTL